MFPSAPVARVFWGPASWPTRVMFLWQSMAQGEKMKICDFLVPQVFHVHWGSWAAPRCS